MLTVAIIGRPNVGKSTLFNRLVGKRLALVDDRPGVTRDRRFGEARLGPMKFTAVDTAGLEDGEAGSLERRMREQTERACQEADLVMFLIDVRAGVTPLDEHVADWIRRQPEKPVLLIAHKHEGSAQDAAMYEAYGLGLGDPLPVSSEHGLGLEHLIDGVRPFWELAEAEAAQADEKASSAEGPIQMAIVGRPNVGKSTLVNCLVGGNRVLVGPEAGVTRDAITVDWMFREQAIRLVDTAGLRRKKKIEDKVEKLSAGDTLRVIRYAQVVVMMLDGTNSIDKQDLSIARHVIEEGRALVIAVNKWDVVRSKRDFLACLNDRLETSLPQVRGVPVLTVSAKTGKGVEALMAAVLEVFGVWNTRIPTSRLNRWLAMMTERHMPPMMNGRRIKLRFMTQAKTRPPSFYISCTQAEKLPDSYSRYLINGLREDFDLPGVPVRLYLRSPKNPFDKG